MDDLDIFILWDMNADSWAGTRTMLSIHQTLDGAEAAIPEGISRSKESLKREAKEPYVANYTYVAIEKRSIGA